MLDKLHRSGQLHHRYATLFAFALLSSCQAVADLGRFEVTETTVGGGAAGTGGTGGAGGAGGAEPTCTDGVQNGAEEGVDCGGTCAVCSTCMDGGPDPVGAARIMARNVANLYDFVTGAGIHAATA